MTHPLVRCAWAVSAAAIVGCARGDADPAALGPADTLASPAAPGSGEPNLATGLDGRVYLSWLEPVGDTTHALKFSVYDGTTWSAPRIIARRSDFFVNWADFPSIVSLPGNRLAAHWLQRSGSTKYAYGIRIAQSNDGGETWSSPTVPHRDGTPTEHGFVSLFPFGDSLGAVWLDGRNFAGATDGEKPDMMLMMTSLAATGVGAERVLDSRVCDCCQTSLAVAASGPLAVYRDRHEGEIRDISIVRWSGSGWSPAQAIHADGWKIDFCPVNGPAIAAQDQRVAVAWFTGTGDSARVYVAQSDDAGLTFRRPIRIDDGRPVGRVDVELESGGGAIVSWMEFTAGQDADVRAKRVSATGAPSTATVIARSSGARASGFPRMALAGEELIFAWTEATTPARVRVARVRLSDPE